MKRPSISVAVSGFDGLDNPHPGIAVAGSIRLGWDSPVEICALGYSPYMTGAWTPGIAESLHILPPLHAGDDAMFDRIAEIHGRRPLNAILPCLDLEVPVFARLATRLAKEGIGTLLPQPESVYATSKLRLPKLCHASNIRVPRTIHVSDLSDLPLHADQFGFPCFVKGIVAGARFVSNRQQMMMESRKLNAEWGGGVLLQDKIAGDEFVVAVLADRAGGRIASVTMRKIGVNEKGKGVLGSVVSDPEIDDYVDDVLPKLNWAGPLELELVRQAGSKNFYLIEINCRFPSWILLSAWSGCNLPAMTVEEIVGFASRQRHAARSGTTFVRDISETAVPMGTVQRLERFNRVEPNGDALRVPRRRASNGIRVAVSGISTFDVVNAGLGVARALNMADGIGAVIGLGYGANDSGMYRGDLFDATYRLPVNADPVALLARLREIHSTTPFDVVIPCLDGELPAFVRIQAALAEHGIRSLLPDMTAFELRTKRWLFTGVHQRDWTGFFVPKTFVVDDDQTVNRAIDELGFPLVIKGGISFALRADNSNEVAAAIGELRDRQEKTMLAQPFVNGTRFAVAAVCDRNHVALAPYTIKKMRVCGRGSTWSAVRVHIPDLEHAFAEFLSTIRWVGPVEGEFIRDDDTERFALIEVNPRATGWIAFTALAGINHAMLAVNLACGRNTQLERGRSDLVFMRSCEDVPVSPLAFAAVTMKGGLRHV